MWIMHTDKMDRERSKRVVALVTFGSFREAETASSSHSTTIHHHVCCHRAISRQGRVVVRHGASLSCGLGAVT